MFNLYIETRSIQPKVFPFKAHLIFFFNTVIILGLSLFEVQKKYKYI